MNLEKKLSVYPFRQPEMIKMGEAGLSWRKGRCLPLGRKDLYTFFSERETVPFHYNKVNGGVQDNLGGA